MRRRASARSILAASALLVGGLVAAPHAQASGPAKSPADDDPAAVKVYQADVTKKQIPILVDNDANVALLGEAAVAVVGTRRCSAAGAAVVHLCALSGERQWEFVGAYVARPVGEPRHPRRREEHQVPDDRVRAAILTAQGRVVVLDFGRDPGVAGRVLVRVAAARVARVSSASSCRMRLWRTTRSTTIGSPYCTAVANSGELITKSPSPVKNKNVSMLGRPRAVSTMSITMCRSAMLRIRSVPSLGTRRRDPCAHARRC